ncbi:MAG: alpha/beta fold hydrolase [Deltaproteobacteria bacterium]|nr:MAG: alpha/beta fold hydrolase [Deltaproteobacteria bacterium]
MGHRQLRLPHGITLHLAEAGPVDGPPVVLLHGFPDCWITWRFQLPALAAAGFRVIAPDLRGYGLSSRPPAVADYRVDALLQDLVALLDLAAGGRAHVVGHDWGGALAWCLAMMHPATVDRLAILNAPHPGSFLRALRSPAQLRRSWYMLAFQVPVLPERILTRLARTHGLAPGPVVGVPPLPEDVRGIYAQCFDSPVALRGPVHYYRALFRYDLPTLRRRLRPVEAPTLVIWGLDDAVLGPALLDDLDDHVRNLRVERLPGVGHFVHQQAPDAVNRLLVDFLPG